MRRSVAGAVAGLLAIVALASCGGAGSGGGSGGSGGSQCTAGGTVKTVNGTTIREFCGPAKVTMTFGGNAFSLSNGECETLSDMFVVNIGTFGLPPESSPGYFGLNVTAGHKVADGSYSGVSLAGNVQHQKFAMSSSGSVTLKNGLTAGDFTGTEFVNEGMITGSFTCS
jgi:hypothetical protein